MSKYIIVPDSFKGSLSARQICRIVEEAARAVEPDCRVCAIPVADGGEGTVETFLTAVGGKLVTVPCHGPYGEEHTGFYGLLPDGTAVVEMAAAAGLPLVGGHRDPEKTTTYGVGEIMAHAAVHGAKRLVLGLGGSATNDGGCGAAAALGVRFLTEQGVSFIPTGGTLHRVKHIETRGLLPELKDIPVVAMCDIDNPLCGANGAAAVFSPQKGADESMVRRLDEGLYNLAWVIQKDLGMDVLHLPGGGAAGGMGAGSVAFFGAALQMGIEAVLDVSDFDRMAVGADLIITGEGQLDGQSLRGKVVVGVARRARKLGVPVAALVGGCRGEWQQVYDQGVTGVFPICPRPMTLAKAMEDSEENLRAAAENMFRFAAAMKK
ncbi:MAG: glycerate kinase [Clostridiales bacterium]|nr:glycerate kinase [Candidatus Cacconaster stercorequi]